MKFCCLCGSQLVWQSDFDALDYGYEENGIVSVYSCSNQLNCNITFEVIDLFDNSHDYSNSDVYDYRNIKYFKSED